MVSHFLAESSLTLQMTTRCLLRVEATSETDVSNQLVLLSLSSAIYSHNVIISPFVITCNIYPVEKCRICRPIASIYRRFYHIVQLLAAVLSCNVPSYVSNFTHLLIQVRLSFWQSRCCFYRPCC